MGLNDDNSCITNITKIVVDLSAWEEHYPCGCIMYNNSVEIDSQFCDDAEEFIEYIWEFKDMLVPYLTNVEFVFDGYGLDNESALSCAKKVWEYTHNLIYGKGN